jgi:hypothetical protein
MPIRLADFSATGEKAGGNRAGGSITPLGIGSKIIDTPTAIRVVTQDLTRAIAAFEIREALDRAANAPRAQTRINGFLNFY